MYIFRLKCNKYIFIPETSFKMLIWDSSILQYHHLAGGGGEGWLSNNAKLPTTGTLSPCPRPLSANYVSIRLLDVGLLFCNVRRTKARA